MARFVCGDRVISKDSGNKGEVSEGFFYTDSNGKPPRHDQIPVQWDNGTGTYINHDLLDYETV